MKLKRRNTKFLKEISHITDAWERLEKLIKILLDDKQLRKKIGYVPDKDDDGNDIINKVDLENSFKDFLRFERSGENANPYDQIREFLNSGLRKDAAKHLGIPKKERDDYYDEDIISVIGDEIGFSDISLKPPEGLTQFMDEAEDSIKIADKYPDDVRRVSGSCLIIFRLLERIFKELIYIYDFWSSSRDSNNTLFGEWYKNSEYRKRLRKNRMTLGGFKKMFHEFDELIAKDKNKAECFFNTLGRPYLLIPIDQDVRFKLPLPDVADYTKLENSIKDRNGIIHWNPHEDVDALSTMKDYFMFMKHLKSEKIFPKLMIQKYYTKYYYGTIRSRMYGENGKSFNLIREKPFDFKCEYYSLETSTGHKYIKRPKDLKEIFK